MLEKGWGKVEKAQCVMSVIEHHISLTLLLGSLPITIASESNGHKVNDIRKHKMKQPHRPAQIAMILKTISSAYPVDVGAALEAYISDLETRQQAVLPGHDQTSSWDPNNPPIWSHQRSLERDQHRRERALKKQNYYR
jgi:hypothetical protein